MLGEPSAPHVTQCGVGGTHGLCIPGKPRATAGSADNKLAYGDIRMAQWVKVLTAESTRWTTGARSNKTKRFLGL